MLAHYLCVGSWWAGQGEAPSSEAGPNGTQPATGTLGSPAPATPSSSTRSDAQRATTTTTTTTTGTASPIGAPASRPSPLLGVLDKFQSSNRFASVSVPLAPLKRPASSEAEPDTGGRSRSYGYDDDDSAARRKRATLDSPAAATSSTGSSSTAKDAGPASATPAAAAAPAAAPVLPEGWYSSKDALGNTYYYHAETSVTQWEVPQAPLAPPPPPPPEVLQALQAAATATAPAVAPSSSSTSAATLKFRDEVGVESAEGQGRGQGKGQEQGTGYGTRASAGHGNCIDWAALIMGSHARGSCVACAWLMLVAATFAAGQAHCARPGQMEE